MWTFSVKYIPYKKTNFNNLICKFKDIFEWISQSCNQFYLRLTQTVVQYITGAALRMSQVKYGLKTISFSPHKRQTPNIYQVY